MAGLGPDDVDVCEFYDPFSFEIIRQFEAFGFCKEGEGGDFVMERRHRARRPLPDHHRRRARCRSATAAPIVQMLQRVIRGVQQVRGECATRQVEGAEVAMCTERRCGRAVHRRAAARQGGRRDAARAADRRDPAGRSRASVTSRTGTAARAASCCSSAARLPPGHAHAGVDLCAHCTSLRSRMGAERGNRCGVHRGPPSGGHRRPRSTCRTCRSSSTSTKGWQILSNLIGCEHDDGRHRACAWSVEFHPIPTVRCCPTSGPSPEVSDAGPDHVAIANLVYPVRGADRRAATSTRSACCSADAVITAEGSDVSWRGSQAITEMYVDGTRRYADGTPRAKHVTTNLMIEVDDARELATCRSYFTVLQQTEGLPLQPIIAGRYHDEFRRARPLVVHPPPHDRRPRRRPLPTPAVRVPPPRLTPTSFWRQQVGYIWSADAKTSREAERDSQHAADAVLPGRRCTGR